MNRRLRASVPNGFDSLTVMRQSHNHIANKDDPIVDNPMTPLNSDDTFEFGCSPEVPCFNACCRDLNQFLMPYDILRLKSRLGIPSDRFLSKYTIQYVGSESGLPIVSFRMDPANDRKCPFVQPEGCSVYEDRPASCRTYPLIRAVSRSRESGRMTEHFMLLKEPHCRGHETGATWTAAQWMKNQELVPYNDMNDQLMEIISLKNQKGPGPLDTRSQDLFTLALYDLDRFRVHISDKGILDDMPRAENRIAAAMEDDVELLNLGIEWVKKTLFGDMDSGK